MKCRVPQISKKMQKEIDGYTKERVAEYYEKQGEEITRRVLKIACAVLNEKFGFGMQRESTFLLGVTEEIKKSKTDEVYWFHKDRDLKSIGLDFPPEDYEVMDE